MMTLNDADMFTATINEMLATNTYQIGLLANSPDDPPFTITFDTPVEGVIVPEPSSLTLLAFGLLAYLSIWRSRQGAGRRSSRLAHGQTVI
jgi:hypothetical protein